MEIEIATIGGHDAVGRQMTAVRAGDDVVVFDMGPNLSQGPIHDNVETERTHSVDLIDMGGIPARQEMADVSQYVDLAESEGYQMGRDLHVSRNGNLIPMVA